MKIDPNASAFPCDHAIPLPTSGLTIRAYFAAMAMQGLISDPDCDSERYSDFAESAVNFADALIVELSK